MARPRTTKRLIPFSRESISRESHSESFSQGHKWNPQRFRRADQTRETINRSVYFPRENFTNPSRFGIFTCRSVCASIVSLSAMMPLRFRI